MDTEEAFPVTPLGLRPRASSAKLPDEERGMSSSSGSSATAPPDDVTLPLTTVAPAKVTSAWSAAREPAPNEGSVEAGAGEQQPPSEGTSSFLGLTNVPNRYLTVAKVSLAFVLANMDKVNLSVAIIPMKAHYGWSSSTAGLVQSSFFWGYVLSLVPSGWLAQKFTGQRVLKVGVVMWSMATAVVPLCADVLPLLMFSRLLVGLGEGVAPPAATDVVARLMPAGERSRAMAVVFNGFNVGSVLGLVISPILIRNFGWPSVFYFFGVAGVLWSLTFNPPLPKEPTETQNGSAKNEASLPLIKEEGMNPLKLIRSGKGESDIVAQDGVPWGAMLRRPAVLALLYTHFCNNWAHFCQLAWLPTFYNSGLKLELGQAAVLSMVPPVLSLIISAVVAPLADKLVQQGTDVTYVRKVAQSAAFLVPSFFMGIVAYCMQTGIAMPPWVVVCLLSLGLGASACSYSGLFCAPQDMSKKYASIILGLSTTVSSIPGILGVPLTGYLYDLTESWTVALFLPSIFFYVTGALVWVFFGDCKPQFFENELKPVN